MFSFLGISLWAPSPVSPTSTASSPRTPRSPRSPKVSIDELPESPPLVPLPQMLKSSHPSLALSPYRLDRPDMASNVLALIHNALRHETKELLMFILPMFRSSSQDQEALRQFRKWWRGYARFICVAREVQEQVIRTSFEEVDATYSKRTRGVQRLFRKCIERLVHTFDELLSACGRSVQDAQTEKGIEKMVRSVEAVVDAVCDTMDCCELLVEEVDALGSEVVCVDQLEGCIWNIMCRSDVGGWGDGDGKGFVGISAVMLFRWCGELTEEYLMKWAHLRCDGWFIERRVQGWLMEYKQQRSGALEGFISRSVVDKAFDGNSPIGRSRGVKVELD